MQGHLRKRGDRWAFVIELERDPETGKRRQKWVSGFGTKEAAQKALRQKLTAIDRDEDPFPPEITVRAFVLERWLPHLETQKRVRARTIASYRQLWTDHVFPAIGGLELRKVRVAHVQAALDGMTAAGKAARTVAHARAAMSAAFRQAVRWQLVSGNVVRDAEAPKKEAPDLRVPTGPELRAIVETARGTPFEVAILLAATTGARRGEVCGLRWGHVDLDNGRVRIVEALAQSGEYLAPKTARAVRTVPIPSWAVERLRHYRRAQAVRLFAIGIRATDEHSVCDRGDGRPLDPGAFTKAAKQIAAQAGVPCRLHDLRHGVATVLAASGGSAALTSKMLGHGSVAFTLQTYTHPDDDEMDRAGAALERALGGAG